MAERDREGVGEPLIMKETDRLKRKKTIYRHSLKENLKW